jgi:festuclavine dehydrogenase
MTIFVLGGRGKTASRLAALFDHAKTPFLVGSSSTSLTSPYIFSQFDWLEKKTWENPFTQVGKHGLGAISSVYLVGPPIMDMAPPMIEFVDLARSKGVQRFVLLSASNIAKGDHSMGKVHAYLDSLAGVEYVALRPTWFMGTIHPFLRHNLTK